MSVDFPSEAPKCPYQLFQFLAASCCGNKVEGRGPFKVLSLYDTGRYFEKEFFLRLALASE
jgi:hypothetical protein